MSPIASSCSSSTCSSPTSSLYKVQTRRRRYTTCAFFWVLPAFAGLSWFGGLLVLLIIWISSGSPRYKDSQADLAFISDVGGTHRHLFITVASTTGVAHVASLVCTAWLRRRGRLVRSERAIEPILAALSIVCAVLSSAALVVLAVFVLFTRPALHWMGTFVFAGAVIASALLHASEIFLLSQHNRSVAHLRRSAIAKLSIVSASLLTALVFILSFSRCKGRVDHHASAQRITYCDRIGDVSALCEWAVSFLFGLYLFSIVLDLYPIHPSGRSPHAAPSSTSAASEPDLEKAEGRISSSSSRSRSSSAGVESLSSNVVLPELVRCASSERRDVEEKEEGPTVEGTKKVEELEEQGPGRTRKQRMFSA